MAGPQSGGVGHGRVVVNLDHEPYHRLERILQRPFTSARMRHGGEEEVIVGAWLSWGIVHEKQNTRSSPVGPDTP